MMIANLNLISTKQLLENMDEEKESFYKCCFVPKCKNTTKTAPDKVFFDMPHNGKMRKNWCDAVKRSDSAQKSTLFCCEDHFRIEQDTQNYTQYKTMKQEGYITELHLKKNVVPHIFQCQQTNIRRQPERKAALKRKSEYYENKINGIKKVKNTPKKKCEKDEKPSPITSHIKNNSNHLNNSLKEDIVKLKCKKEKCKDDNENLRKDSGEPKNEEKNPKLSICEPQQKQNENGTKITNVGTEPIDTMCDVSTKESINDSIDTLECRACLENVHKDNLIDMFQSWSNEQEGVGVTVAEDLSNLTRVQISMTDSYSKFICMSCHQRLLDSCMFVTKVQRSQQILKERHNSGYHENYWPKPIQLQTNSSLVLSAEAIKIKEEILSEDENGEPITNDNSQMMEIKVEPEEILEPKFDVHSDSVEQSDGHSNTDNISSNTSNLDMSKDLMPFRITVNGTITSDQFERTPVMTIHGDLNNEKENPETRVKEEPMSDNEDSVLVNEMPLECMLCMKSFSTVLGLKVHVIAHHSYGSVKRNSDGTPKLNSNNEEIVCSTCRRKFLTTTDLMVHETCHGKYACYGCQAQFDSYQILTDHTKTCKCIKKKRKLRLRTLDDVKRRHCDSPNLEEDIPSYVIKKENCFVNIDTEMNQIDKLESDYESD